MLQEIYDTHILVTFCAESAWYPMELKCNPDCVSEFSLINCIHFQ